MSEKRIIAIVGATGAQGGGLARAALRARESGFLVRAITRTPRSDAARALSLAGAEIVAADADDPASLEAAFDGAYGAFCVTNFWEHFSPERELAQASNMARAAAKAKLKHVIWSTLEDSRQVVDAGDEHLPTLMGRYKVPHTDAKGEADARFLEAGVPTTFLLTSFYWENFLSIAPPRRDPGGNAFIALPLGDKKLAGIATEDIGKCALGVFERGRELIGEYVGIAGEHLTGAEMAAGLSRAMNETVQYRPLPVEVFRAMARDDRSTELERQTGFSISDDTANMFHLLVEHERDFLSARDLARSRALNSDLQTFGSWLAGPGSRLRVAG